jgi:NadR type nicotinamide-nucleotide adenylyltransferase
MEKNPGSPTIKIAIVGPESTGKSTITEALAKHFDTVFVPEYARTYIGELQRNYLFEDIEKIAQTQLRLENEMLHKAQGVLFCDTTLLVTKIWAEHRFKKKSKWIEDHYLPGSYDLHLLLDIDLPWQFDPQREHPHLRRFFLEWYKKELEESKANFYLISGNDKERLQRAIAQVGQLLETPSAV